MKKRSENVALIGGSKNQYSAFVLVLFFWLLLLLYTVTWVRWIGWFLVSHCQWTPTAKAKAITNLLGFFYFHLWTSTKIRWEVKCPFMSFLSFLFFGRQTNPIRLRSKYKSEIWMTIHFKWLRMTVSQSGHLVSLVSQKSYTNSHDIERGTRNMVNGEWYQIHYNLYNLQFRMNSEQYVILYVCAIRLIHNYPCFTLDY